MNKPMVHKYVNQITFDWDKISGELITFLQDGATSMLNSTVSAITDVVQFIVSFALGFVFALNALLQKEKIINAGEKGIGRFFTGTGCEVYCTSWKTIK